MDKSAKTISEKINSKMDTFYLQHAKELSSLLKNSSTYWKGTFSNMKNNLLSCSRPDIIEEETQKNEEIKNVQENSHQNQRNIFELNLKENKSQQSNFNTNDIIPKNEFLKTFDKQNTEQPQILCNFPAKSQIYNKNFHSTNDPFLEIPLEASFSQSNNLFLFNNNPSENLSLCRKFWTQEEDEKLIRLVDSSIGRNWKKISQFLLNKTPQQCAYRYNKLISSLNKRKWSRNEDILLIELIEIYGQNWREIFQRMQGRTIEEVKERFEKKLDPKLKRCKFKKEEDEMILSLFEKYGNKWEEIAKYFMDRSANMIKNRFYSHLRKKISKSIDPSQIENLLDSKSFMSSTQKNLSIKEIRTEDNQIQNHFNISPLEFQNKNLGSNLNNLDLNMDEWMKFPKISDNLENKIINKTFLNRNIIKFTKDKLNPDKNQEAYPDNLRYTVPYYDDISMKLDLPETIHNPDYFHQNLDGIFSHNINTNINTFPNTNNQMNFDVNNNFNKNNSSLFRNNSFDLMQMSQQNDEIENSKNYSINTCKNKSENILKKYNSSKVDKLIQNSFHKQESDKLQVNPFRRIHSSEMLLDDTEANNIPKDLIVIDTDSPKEEFFSDDPDKNFDKHYKNIFKYKKVSFEQENISDNLLNNFNPFIKTENINKNPKENKQRFITNQSTISAENSKNNNSNVNNVDITSNNQNLSNDNFLDNDELYKQFKMLEEVLNKVTDVSMNQINKLNLSISSNLISDSNYSIKNDIFEMKRLELIEINQTLNSKRKILTDELKNLENHYNSLNSKSPLYWNTSSNENTIKSNEAIRDSLMNHIDNLIELINITKKKISLIQDIENEIK